MKFFNSFRRKILGTGFSKYLLYAIGEIVLVVIGILLAIAINNYYQKKAIAEKTNAVVSEIYNQMVADSLKIHEYIDYLGKLKYGISYYRLPVDQRKKEKRHELGESFTKISLFFDRDKDFLNMTNSVANQIEKNDFTAYKYSKQLYDIQTDYNLNIEVLRNQERLIMNKNNAFNENLAKKYDWYIDWNATLNCKRDCFTYIGSSEEFNRYLAIYQYEKTFIYRIRIEQFQEKLRAHIRTLKSLIDP